MFFINNSFVSIDVAVEVAVIDRKAWRTRCDFSRPIKINEILACAVSFPSDFGRPILIGQDQIVLILFDFYRPICSACGVFRFLSVISTNQNSCGDHMV